MAVFVLISGMLLIMFDVSVPPKGICAILFLRSLTPYSQAVKTETVISPPRNYHLCFLANPKLIRRHVFSRLLVRAAPPDLPRTF